jgi:hypothetical protein
VNQRRLAAATILMWEAAEPARTANEELPEFAQPAPEFVQRGGCGTKVTP